VAKAYVYLAGGIEAADKLGVGWRKKITPFLQRQGFSVLDPTKLEPKQLKGLKKRRLPKVCVDRFGNKRVVKHWHDLKRAVEPNLYMYFTQCMRRVIRYDMNLVTNQADIILVFWDSAAARGAGTHAEITQAFLSRKPVICIAAQSLPGWLKACCHLIFYSFEDFYAYCKKLDHK